MGLSRAWRVSPPVGGEPDRRQGETDAARKALEDGIGAATRTGDAHALSEMRGMLDTLPD